MPPIKDYAAEGGRSVPREKRLWFRNRELAREMGKRAAALKKQRKNERQK